MKFFLHSVFWLLLFSVGLFQLLEISSSIYKPFFPLIPFFLFGIQLVQNFESIKLPGIKYVLLFVLLAIVSGVVNNISIFATLYFLIFLFYPVFYFYVIINDDSLSLRRIRRLLIVLILIQIPASFVKYFYWGIGEGKAIGTMATDAGSLAAIFPLFIISFLLPLYYKTNKNIYLILVGLFTLFGVIGEKRVLFILLPILILYSIFTYWYINSYRFDKKALKTWGFSFVGGCVLFYGIVILNPTLNPEKKVGGTFDIEYLYNYTLDYTDSDDRSFREMRRMAGLMYFTNYATGNLKTSLVGDGAGKLVQSRFTPGEGTILENYGVRYGGRMAFIWLLLQVGIGGVILFLIIHFKLYVRIRQKLNRGEINTLYIGYANLVFVLLFDFFFYSTVSIQADVVYCLFMLIVAMLYRGEKSFRYRS